jgi:predicted nucleic acid-binding protein
MHTPGPWTIDGSFIRRTPEDDEFRGDIVASIVESARDGGGVTADANARLMTAAPDMLAACMACIPHMEMGTRNESTFASVDRKAVLQMLRAAIAKAVP